MIQHGCVCFQLVHSNGMSMFSGRHGMTVTRDMAVAMETSRLSLWYLVLSSEIPEIYLSYDLSCL